MESLLCAAPREAGRGLGSGEREASLQCASCCSRRAFGDANSRGEGVHGADSLTAACAWGRRATTEVLGLAQFIQLKLNFLTEIHSCCFPSYLQGTRKAAFSFPFCGSSLSIAEG